MPPAETGAGPTSESPVFFSRGGVSLFGVLHQPAGAPTGHPWVFCHPFAEEKLWTHRVFVSFARRLAASGHVVFRFDYMGNGDSAGEFADSSLASALADVRGAIDYVRHHTGSAQVSLLGLRLGATIAALAAESATDVRQLVLWAPVIDGARYMQEMLRTNLTTQMAVHREIRQDREALVAAMRAGEAVNVDGYEMTYRLYSDVSAVKLAAGPKQHAGPCLIVHVDRQAARLPAEAQQLASGYSDATLTAAAEEPFWKEIQHFYQEAANLFASTEEWLRGKP